MFEGEEHGPIVYEEALKSDSLSTDQRDYVGDVLLSNQRKHMALLEELKRLPH